MKLIYIYDEDLQKLMAMVTWKKFKGCSYADIIKWMLENDAISGGIYSILKVNKK